MGGGSNSTLNQIGMFGIKIDENRIPPGQNRPHASRSRSGKRVKYRPWSFQVLEDDLMHEFDRLDRWVMV